MGDTTAISWCDHTWNPWIGCEPVSAGCDNCYARTLETRFGRDFTKLRRTSAATFYAPFTKWRKLGKVFTCSMSDFFHADADQWRADAWKLIRDTPHLTYQILTKRHGRIARCLPPDWGNGYPNVWLGVSVEDQFWAERRVPVLLSIPAAVRFVSYEPALGPVDFTRIGYAHVLRHSLGQAAHFEQQRGDPGGYAADLRQAAATEEFEETPWLNALTGEWFDGWDSGGGGSTLSWIIAGGESGPGYRHADTDWFRKVRDDCLASGTAFWFKQSGGPRPETGRELDGVRWEQFPA